ncbi:MAG: D-glycerate dehydrogenase [Maritimibacter sp.]
MAKIFVTRPMPQAVIDDLEHQHEVVVRGDNSPMLAAEMVAALSRYEAILPTLGDLFSAEVFEQAGEIRTGILANFGVGYNHIDVEAARAHGAAVTNTPGVLTDATADLAMSLLLATARRAGEGERLLRAGEWQGWHPTQLMGRQVSGKRVGVVGMGRIGQAIARRCHYGFGMQVLFYNRSPRALDFPATQIADIVDLAGQVDFLVLAVPGGAETHHLINASVLAAMQPQAMLINIARGDVVDEAALISALSSGQIAGAGLDVYEREPQVPALSSTAYPYALSPTASRQCLRHRLT